MGRAVGFNLGTTNSVVAVLEGTSPAVVVNAEGSRTTPSVVAFTDEGEVLVGRLAKNQAVTNPDNTIRSAKRHIGTDWSTNIYGKQYNSQEISARVLQKLKRDAETYLGEEKAYAYWVKTLHPDKHAQGRLFRKKAEEETKQLNATYNEMKDKRLRQEYDNIRRTGQGPPNQQRQQQKPPPRKPPPRPPKPPPQQSPKPPPQKPPNQPPPNIPDDQRCTVSKGFGEKRQEYGLKQYEGRCQYHPNSDSRSLQLSAANSSSSWPNAG